MYPQTTTFYPATIVTVPRLRMSEGARKGFTAVNFDGEPASTVHDVFSKHCLRFDV